MTEITNQSKFQKWTVLSFSHKDDGYRKWWNCQCDCGTVKTLKADDFRNKETRSCGCLQLSRTRDERIHDEQLLKPAAAT